MSTEVAKSLFMHNQFSPEKISYNTGIPVETVRKLIYGDDGSGLDPECWLYERMHTPLITEEQYEAIAPVLISHTKANALRIASKVMENVDEDEATLTDASLAVDILTKIDKIDRLDKGKATSITGVELDRMDAKDVVGERRRRSDYIDDIEDVEYEVRED